MDLIITADQIKDFGLSAESASVLMHDINAQLKICVSASEAWIAISENLSHFSYPFSVHLFVFNLLFPNWHDHPLLAPAWQPSASHFANANIAKWMAEKNLTSVADFHLDTAIHYQVFWLKVIEHLNIRFEKPPSKTCDLTHGIEAIRWFPDAKLNIALSAFNAPDATPALIFPTEKNQVTTLTYGELNRLSNRVAASLVKLGFAPGDPIGLVMPMNHYAVAIYLGIIKMGGVVVTVADSFSSAELAMRFDITKVTTAFTQDTITWSGKKLALYDKLKQAGLMHLIVVPEGEPLPINGSDYAWHDFLLKDDTFEPVARDPMDACHILFSSGTTATPKAIPWTHLTPIKAASDAFFHQDIKPGDVLAWPTNLGWMMGPWLVFAALINQATIALFPDAPKDETFGKFVETAKVTMLGVVPTLVAAWRQSKCMESFNWRNIKVFSSTGESSNPEDMLYLMYLAGYKPIIEYCGGTEIGGSYVSSTVIQTNFPSLFSTQVMGVRFVLLDDNKQISTDGEVAIVPPALGLSTSLINMNHHQAYFADMPTFDGVPLRRHGDHFKQLDNGYYQSLGRMDDAMNLGGIKISAAEIERAISGIEGIVETAAIAVSAKNHEGPSQLIICAVVNQKLVKEQIKSLMQKKINTHLNPLFKITDLVFLETLPKTPSNKIMRRLLRNSYERDKLLSD